MTGQGEARVAAEDLSVAVEVRSVNNRFLKVAARVSESIASLESAIEGWVRQKVGRGAVSIQVRVQAPNAVPSLGINADALRRYMEQSLAVAQEFNRPIHLSPGEYLMLPGVVDSPEPSAMFDDRIPALVETAVLEALDQLNAMRSREGENMANELRAIAQQLESLLASIRERAPKVLSEYRNRLDARVRQTLSEYQIEVPMLDLLREVHLYSDKIDIHEELVRFDSHLSQFRAAMSAPESQGRKLDFIIQEFFREASTIGAKANDATISNLVVEIKTRIEQAREIIQNVE